MFLRFKYMYYCYLLVQILWRNAYNLLKFVPYFILQLINSTQSTIEDDVRTYFCEPGYYNDMATLFFNSQEEAIKQLFHQPGQQTNYKY